MAKLKLSVAQEKFILKILSKHPEFVIECGWSELELDTLYTIYSTGSYYDWNRDLLNGLRENAKTAGILI